MSEPGTRIPVFLSYARADDDPDYDDPAKSFMRRLYEHLSAEGFEVWWDRESLPSRSLEFTKEIETAIRACDRFVLIVGPGAVASPYVTAEWRFALEQCKPVTPVLRAGDYPIIPADLGDINAIDCRPTRTEADALDDIANRLREAAPLGQPIGIKPLPQGFLNREGAFKEAQQAIMADAINPTVISAPARAVAVYGMGGVGKSTLAASLALDCRVRRHFRDGILWIEVGQTPTIESLQASIGVHFGDSRDNYRDARDGALSLSRILADKAALIVLDDVWDHKLVERFPVGGTACRLLITTRSSRLAAQVQGADVRLSLLSPEEGAQLIANRAAVPADEPAAREIVTLLGGHTLSIALAASQIASGYADDVADMLRLLRKRAGTESPFKDLAVDPEDKDANLDLSLAQSYEMLTPDLQRRFRATGVFALEGSFDRAALAAVWGDDDEDDARKPLAVLEGASLLEASDEPGRYQQHRLLRAYARALLLQTGELEETQAQHFDYYFKEHSDYYANQAHNEDGSYIRHATLESDWEQINLALDWGFENKVTQAIDWVGALQYFTKLRISTEQRFLVLQKALSSSRSKQYLNGEANVLQALGELSLWRDQLSTANTYYRKCLEIFEHLDNQVGQANTLFGLGSLDMRFGQLNSALEHFDRALPIFEALDAKIGQANTLKALGDLNTRLAKLSEAEEYYIRSVVLFDSSANFVGKANALRALGDLWRLRNEIDTATRYYQEALSISDRAGDKLGQANNLRSLGDTKLAFNEYVEAIEYYQNALAISQSIDDRLGIANSLRKLGGVNVQMGNTDAAVHYYDSSLPYYEISGDRLGQANTLQALGDLCRQNGQYDQAILYYTKAEKLFVATGDQLHFANILKSLGDLYLQLNQLDNAITYYKQTLPIYEATGDRLGSAHILKALGDVSWRIHEVQQAHKLYDGAEHIYRTMGDLVGLANILISKAQLAHVEEHPEIARRYLEELFAIINNHPSFKDHPITQELKYKYQLLYANTNQSNDRTSILPQETVQHLTQNTYDVMTAAIDHRDEWRENLTGLRATWDEQGEDYAIEVAFADALLAILDGQSPTLPPDNPYADVVRQVVEAIAGYTPS